MLPAQLTVPNVIHQAILIVILFASLYLTVEPEVSLTLRFSNVLSMQVVQQTITLTLYSSSVFKSLFATIVSTSMLHFKLACLSQSAQKASSSTRPETNA